MIFSNFLLSPTKKFDDSLDGFLMNEVSFQCLQNQGYPKIDVFLERNTLLENDSILPISSNEKNLSILLLN